MSFSSKDNHFKFSFNNFLSSSSDVHSLNFRCSSSQSNFICQKAKSKSFFNTSKFQNLSQKPPQIQSENIKPASFLNHKKLILFPKQNYDFNSETNKVRIFHQKPNPKLTMKNTNNLIMSLHRRPARDTESITSKLLFRSNISKFFEGKFSKTIEENPHFSLNLTKKTSHLTNEPLAIFDQEKVKGFLLSFSKNYPVSFHNSSLKGSCIEQFKTLSKLDFKEKEKSENFVRKINGDSYGRSHKRAFSHYSYTKETMVSPKERTKFARIIHYDEPDARQKKFLFDQNIDSPQISADFLMKEEEFEELPEEKKTAKTRKNTHQIEIYDIILSKIKAGEKKKETSFLNSTYKTHYKKTLLKERMLFCLKKLAKMKLNIKDLVKISYKPYQREGSVIFFEAVRLEDIMKIEEMLNKNRLLIYDFNQFQHTALHIACKKQNLQIVKILIENGAELNAVDLTMKTPLFIAISKNFMNGIRFLLYSGANPWSSKECVYEKVVNSEMAKFYLKKAREIFIILKLMKIEKEKKKIWLNHRRLFSKILK